MNCFLDLQRRVAVPSSSCFEVSKVAAEFSLRQRIPSASGDQQIAFVQRAQAAGAAVLAERHMSPALVKRTRPQVGHSTILRTRNLSPSPFDVRRFGQQELRGMQPQGRPSQEQHQARQDPQPCHLQQEHQQRRQEPCHQQCKMQYGGENQPVCNAASTNDRLYLQRQLHCNAATAMQARSQYEQQFVSPVAYGKLPLYTQQMQHLKGACTPSSAHENRSYQTFPKASECGQVLFSATPVAAPCVTSSGDSVPEDSIRASCLQQAENSSCPQQLYHIDAARQSTTATPSHPRIPTINSSGSTGDGISSRGRSTALLFRSSDSPAGERPCQAPSAAAFASNSSSRPQSVLTPEAAAVDLLTTTTGIDSAAPAPGDRKETLMSRVATETAPGKAARDSLSNARPGIRLEASKNTLASPCQSSLAPQQQTSPAHFSAQGFAESPLGNNSRVAHSPVRCSRGLVLYHSSDDLRCRLPSGMALTKVIAGTGSPQVHAADGHLLRTEIDIEGAADERNLLYSSSTGQSQITGRNEKVEQQPLPQERQPSSSCSIALQSRVRDRSEQYKSTHSLGAGTKMASTAQQIAGFALGRPRTRLREPVRQAHQHWLPQRQLRAQLQENAQQSSCIQQQMLLQQQLRQLQVQHPYSWAASGSSVGHGSPITITRSVPKMPLVSGQMRREPHVYASVLSNALTSACCWQPHSPRGEGERLISSAVSSSVAPKARSRLDCVISADGATRIQIKEHPQGFQETVGNQFKKRPTSAPPGQNDRPLPACLVALPHRHRALWSSGAQLDSLRGVPWQSPSHQIVQQRNIHVGVGIASTPQTSWVTPASPRTTSNLAFSLIPTVAALERGATGVVDSLRSTGLDSSSTLSRPGNCSAQEEKRDSASTQFRPLAQPDTITVPVLVPAEENANSSFPGIRSTEAPLVSSAVVRSAAEASTAALRNEIFSSSLNLQTTLAIVAEKRKPGVRVPSDAKNNPAGETLHYTPGSAPCHPTPMTTQQKEQPGLPFNQRVDSPATAVEKVCSSAVLPQLRPQPQGSSALEDSVRELTINGKCRLADRKERTYEVKTASVGTHLSEESGKSVAGQQQQDQSKLQQAHGTQSKQLSDRLLYQQHQSAEDGQTQQEHEQNQVTLDYHREAQLRTWQMQYNMPRVEAVMPSIDRTPATANLQPSIESAAETGREHLETCKPRYLATVISREDALRQQRSLSCAEISFLPFKPLAVETQIRSSSLCTPVASRRKKDKVVKHEPQRPFKTVPMCGLHSTDHAAIGDASGATLQCIGRLSMLDQVSANSNMIRACSSRHKSFKSLTEKDSASEKAELEQLRMHEQQVGRALLGDEAVRSSGTIDSSTKSTDSYARSSLSTMGSKDSGVGSDSRDEASKRSRASSTSRASSCRPTTHCSRKSKNRSSKSIAYNNLGNISPTCNGSKRSNCSFDFHAYPEMPEGKLDNNGEKVLKNSTTFAAQETRGTHHRSASSGDPTHIGSADNLSCAVRTHTEGNDNEPKSGNGRVHTQVKAGRSNGSSRRETCGHPEEKVERTRLRSITSTDVSRCTGRSTTTSNEHIVISGEVCPDADKEGEEDVIPLPAFLWHSPLSLHRNPEGDHSFRSGTARTTAGLHDRPGYFRDTLHSKQSSHNEEEKLTPAATIGNGGNNHAEQRHSHGDGGSSNTATLQMADFELADPRFGGEASLLGRGTYGIVRLMRHKPTGRLYAVKSIEKSSVVEAGMVSQVEFELLTQKDVLRHRNILRCYAFMEDVDRVHMILEYCSGGDLYTRIRTQPQRRINEEEAFLYFAQLVNGLHYMHTRCIMHRDLKLENLLLDKDGVLKIADLGWCTTILGKRRNFNFCGTLDYLAPEMVRGDGHDWRVDLWGAGILLYEMLDGKPPFQSTRHLELVQQILKAKINLPSHIPPDAGNLIEQLLQYDPEDRIPLHAICQHPWVKRMWSQLKKHYYHVYPNAAPAAFDLCSPASTARQQIEDALSKTRGCKKPLVDLRDIYPVETAGTTTYIGDRLTKTKKIDKFPPAPTNGAQRDPSAACFSDGSAALDVQQGLAVATTAADRGYADNARPYSEATAAAAQQPCETPASATCTEARSDSIPSAAPKPVVETGQTLEARDGETHKTSYNSASDNRGSLQQQRGRTVSQISERKQRDSSNSRAARKSADSVAGPAAKERNIRAFGSTIKRGRDSAGSLEDKEHCVARQEQEMPVRPSDDGCSVSANPLGDSENEFRLFAGTAVGSERRRSSRTAMSCAGAVASPASPAAGTRTSSAAIAAKEQWNPRRAAVLPFISTAAKEVIPPVAAARGLPGMRARTLRKIGTGAAPGRRATATTEAPQEAVYAATSGASILRVGDKSTGRTAVEAERSTSSDNSSPNSKAKRSAAASRPRVFQQVSKIDSGLGSQKNMLMSPPMKRSALRAREPWDGNTSRVKMTGENDLDAEETLWPSPHRTEQQDFVSSQELQQSASHAGQQQQQQQTQLRSTVNLLHQHSPPPQASAQVQQLLYCHPQLQPALDLLHQRDLNEQTDAKKCQAPQQQGTVNEKKLYSSLGVQEQKQVHHQSSAQQQPLVRRYVGEQGSSTSHQSPSSHSHLLDEPGYNCLNQSFASTAIDRVQDSAHQPHIQYLQRVNQQGPIQQRQLFSPTHNRQLQVHSNDSHPPQNTTASQQSPVSWAAWYLHAKQQHAKQQQQLLLAQQQVASEQHAFPKVPAAHLISSQCRLLGPQQRMLYPLQQTLNSIPHIRQQEPICEERHSQHQQPDQAQLENLKFHQQRQRLDQNHQVNSLSSKETPTKLSYQPVQQGHASFLQASLHQQAFGQQPYLLGHQQKPLRSMTPPAATTLYKTRNAANSVPTRIYHFLPQQQYIPWHAQAVAHIPTQFVHSSSSNLPFYNTAATQEQVQDVEKNVQPPSCAADINVASEAAQEGTQAASIKNDDGTNMKGVTVARALQPPQLKRDPTSKSKEEDAHSSTAKSKNCPSESFMRDKKEQSKYTTSGQIARVGGSFARMRNAHTSSQSPANASVEASSVTRHQAILPPAAGVRCNDLYAYTPRWGGSRQAAADRSATVAPPSLLSPVASTARLRSLLAVSAPPRSCAAAAIARRPPRGVAVPGSSEQQRQRRQQVQQMRQQPRPGKVVYAHQQQQRRPQQRGGSPQITSPSRQHIQQTKEEGCLRTEMTDADDACRSERLSCFSFGYKGELNYSQSRETSSSDLALFSDRLSAGSTHDVGLISQGVNPPETHSGNPSLLVPSAKARQVLNKLFENSTPPGVPKSSGAKLVEQTPATAGARTEAKRLAAEEATSAVEERMSEMTAEAPTTEATVSITAAPTTSEAAVAMTSVATSTITTRAADPSPKTVYRLRQAGSRSRFHAHSPTPCGASTAAVAAAAVAWRARSPEKESRERKSPADPLLRVGKMMSTCTRQLLPDVACEGRGGQGSSSRKIMNVHAQGSFDMVARCRTGGQGAEVARKTQRMSDLLARKGISSSPLRRPQIHATAGTQKHGPGGRATVKGVVTSPPRPARTAVASAGRTERFFETDAEVPPIRNHGDPNSTKSCGASSKMSKCTTFRPARRDSVAVAERNDKEKTTSPSKSLSSSLPPEKRQHLQQQSAPPETCFEQKMYTSIPKCEYGLSNSSLESAGAPLFLETMQSASASTPDFPTPPCSPSMRPGPPSEFISGQTPNSPSCLPGHRTAAPAAGAAAAQQVANNMALCPRYWSPPCRVSDVPQWRSCSSSERAFLGRQAVPQLLANFTSNQQALSVVNSRTGHYPPALTQQRANAPSIAAAGRGALTSSWIARERNVYTTRQQTPPPSAVNQAARGMRQGTPPWSGMPGGQQHPCHSLKSQVTHPTGSTNGGALVYTFATAAGRRLDPSWSPGALCQQRGSAVVAGISAAGSTTTCHVRPGPAHAQSGKGFGLFSFSNQR